MLLTPLPYPLKGISAACPFFTLTWYIRVTGFSTQSPEDREYLWLVPRVHVDTLHSQAQGVVGVIDTPWLTLTGTTGPPL